jgi:hypothetical protein
MGVLDLCIVDREAVIRFLLADETVFCELLDDRLVGRCNAPVGFEMELFPHRRHP